MNKKTHTAQRTLAPGVTKISEQEQRRVILKL